MSLVKPSQLAWEKYNEIGPFFLELSQKGRLESEHASELWARLLSERKGFPAFNDILLFRRMHLGFSFSAKHDEKQALHDFNLEFNRCLSEMPPAELSELEESDVGMPRQYAREGVLSSHNGLRNAFSANRVIKNAEKLGSPSDVILEIGPGFGGVADILIRRLNPKAYVICDLPHNLYLSSFYLSINHPERKIVFIDQETKEIPDENCLVFCTPPGLELAETSYDIVVNTYSLQEMNKPEIHRYFNLISDRLTEKGFFYFVNNIGEIGAIRPSDYPFDLFKIHSWRPMIPAEPKFLHKKQHMEAVLTKGHGSHWPDHFDEASYPLVLMMNAGLGQDVEQICINLAIGNIDQLEREFCSLAEKVLLANSPQQAHELEQKLMSFSDWQKVSHYLLGIVAMADGDSVGAAARLERALELGLQDLAKGRALFALGLLAPSKQTFNQYFQRAMYEAPIWEPDINSYSQQPNLNAFLAAYRFVFPGMDILFKPSDGAVEPSLLSKMKHAAKKVLNAS